MFQEDVWTKKNFVMLKDDVHIHTHPCTSIGVRTFIGIMFHPATYPNHHSHDPNTNLNIKFKTRSQLSKKILKVARASQNVLTS